MQKRNSFLIVALILTLMACATMGPAQAKEVKLTFSNRVNEATSNQILIFLQPVSPKENYLFSAWQVLNPSIGSTQNTMLVNTFQGSIATFGDSRGNYADPVGLTLGKALEITNPNDQSPVIGNPVEDITAEAVGLLNNAITPKENLSVKWYVNDSLVVETDNTPTTTLNPGFKSTFQLKQFIYVMLGQKPNETETYILQNFSKTQEFEVPNDATELCFETFTSDSGDKFRKVDCRKTAEELMRYQESFRKGSLAATDGKCYDKKNCKGTILGDETKGKCFSKTVNGKSWSPDGTKCYNRS